METKLNIIKNIAEGIFRCPVRLYEPQYEKGNEWSCTAGLAYCRLQLFEVVGGVFLDISDTLPRVKRITCAFENRQEDLPYFCGHIGPWTPSVTKKGIFCLVVDEKEVGKDPERVAYLWQQ